MLKKTLTTLAAGLALAFAAQSAAFAEPVKNIVLVHGAFADGSGWQAVTKILDKAGYHVSIVQEPQTRLPMTSPRRAAFWASRRGNLCW